MEEFILNFLVTSGPATVYPLFFIFLWLQHRKIQSLDASVEKLAASFTEFKLEYERKSVKMDAITRIEEAIKENERRAVERTGRIFEKIDEINRSGCAKIGTCKP